MNRLRRILFSLFVTAACLLVPPAQNLHAFEFGIEISILPPRVSVGFSITMEDVRRVLDGIGRLFGGSRNRDRRHAPDVVYAQYDERTTRVSGTRYSFSPSSSSSAPDAPPPPPPPLIRISYGEEDHHSGRTLRLLYRHVRDNDRIPLYGDCGLVIEDGVDGRPDGALRFDACGFEGYALYYPVAKPRGTQLRVWKDGVENPVLILSRQDDTIVILEHDSVAGREAMQVFIGGPES